MDYNSSPKLAEKSPSIQSFEDCSSDEEISEQNIPTKAQKSYIGVTTGLHLDYTNSPNSPVKIKYYHFCKSCSYKCRKESDLIKHYSTTKHKTRQNGEKLAKNHQNSPTTFIQGNEIEENNENNENKHRCICGNSYKFRQGLYKHKKSCSIALKGKSQLVVKDDNNNVIDKDMLMKIVLGNQELMKEVILNNQANNVGINSHNNINTNSHNSNTFNIQMFLNEHCKNAMNLTDFINTLPITNETYNHTIENGLTKTITHMITDGLSNMDVLERPIHCTDSSRKTLYIKDNDVWEKDNELNKILNGIKTVALKQRTMINKWKDANQGWEENENLQNQLTSLVFNSMTLIEQDEKEMNKIVRAISKNTYITQEIKEEYK